MLANISGRSAMRTDLRLLDALDEPALVLTIDGTILYGNSAARRFFRDQCSVCLALGSDLADVVHSPPDRLRSLLASFRRSAQPVIGSVAFVGGAADGGVAYAVRGCRIAVDEQPHLLVRIQVAEGRRFRALTETMQRLNAELSENKRIRLRLQGALADKDVLLRELNHRVKNNLQVLQGIIALSERTAGDEQVRGALAGLRNRVEAMGVVQRLLYRRDDLTYLDGPEFLDTLVSGAAGASGRPGITVATCCEPLGISTQSAFLVGLVVNELLVNALKHAFDGRAAGSITVRLVPLPDRCGGLRLTIEDDGVGMTSTPSAGTGLALVRRLVGAAGGTLEVDVDDGTRWTVVFRDPSAIET